MTDRFELINYTLHGNDGDDQNARRSFQLKCMETGVKYYCERFVTAERYNPKHLLNHRRANPDAPIKDEFGCQLPSEHVGYADFQYRDSSYRISNGEICECWTGMSEGKFRDIKQEIADFLDTFEFGPDDIPVSEIPRKSEPEVTAPGM